TLEQTCTDDPFNIGCTIGYESERIARLDHCIIGGNAANDARCDSAKVAHSCINHPFSSDCDDRLPQHYEQARANRVAFCRTVGNADNALCTVETTFAHICRNHPFDAQCRGDNVYRPIRRTACSGDPFATRCAGDAYNDLRVNFCEDNVGTPACPTPEPQVTAEVWADSFDEDLAQGVTAEDTESKFLIGRESDLDTGEVNAYRSYSSYNGRLNLADATFNGVALGGDVTDGVAFFAAEQANNDGYYSYVGILSGTNLGAPLTDTIGSAKWIGRFKVSSSPATDFVLNVSFGTGDGAGEIEALVQKNPLFDYHIEGEFDDAGVITGTARQGYYKRDNDPDPANRGRTIGTGALTGLIGEEGAVGGFVINNNIFDVFGVFVARPSSAEELRTLAQTCADDPFHEHCNLGYESERNAVIEHCIIGGNANDEICSSAKGWQSCIHDPFGISCYKRLPQHYEQARANRLAFCRTAGNAGNALCTAEWTFSYVCRNYPFSTQCLGNSAYDQTRQNACDRAGTGSTECGLLAGLNCGTNPFHSYCDSGYNDARASACNANPGQLRCADTVERVCNGNPFDTLCRNTTVYLNARKTHCRRAWDDP
nr:hypothetical protein [Pseudomonadota bacterium]